MTTHNHNHTDTAGADMTTTTADSGSVGPDASDVPTCGVCEEPVALAEPHYTLPAHRGRGQRHRGRAARRGSRLPPPTLLRNSRIHLNILQ